MAHGHLTNEEHARLAAWADELFQERGPGWLPVCPYCALLEDVHHEMQFRHGNIHREPIAWGQNRKCSRCYFLASFGVPMTEDEFQKTKALMDGRRNYNGKPIEDIEEQAVQDQLEALGYLEM